MSNDIDNDGKKSNKIKECPECGSKSIITDFGKAEIYCADCGMIISESIIDLGPEWRAFDSTQTAAKTRTGAPMTYRIHDKGLSTVVSSGPGMNKLQKWQRRAHIANSSERSLIFALSEIDRMASALRLPVNIREQASMLYRKAMEKRLIRGRSIESITSALIYITCRQYGVSRTLEEVTKISRVEYKKISRVYRYLLREMNLKITLTSPVEYVPRFCSELNLGSEIRSNAIAIIKKTEEVGLTDGRLPIGIAAAAIYIATILNKEHRTQKQVSDVTGVTEVTIRNRYKEISKKFGGERQWFTDYILDKNKNGD